MNLLKSDIIQPSTENLIHRVETLSNGVLFRSKYCSGALIRSKFIFLLHFHVFHLDFMYVCLGNDQ